MLGRSHASICFLRRVSLLQAHAVELVPRRVECVGDPKAELPIAHPLRKHSRLRRVDITTLRLRRENRALQRGCMAQGGWAALVLLDVRVFAWTSRWRDDLLLMTRLRVWDCRVNALISDPEG